MAVWVIRVIRCAPRSGARLTGNRSARCYTARVALAHAQLSNWRITAMKRRMLSITEVLGYVSLRVSAYTEAFVR